MNKQQRGMTSTQVLMAVVSIAVLAVIALPRYHAFSDKAKLTEAFTLAHESKRRISEFYVMNNRFPASEIEARSLMIETVTPPEYVEEMAVVPSEDETVTIKVFLKPDAVENIGADRQFVFLEVRRAPGKSSQIEWFCGANGIDAGILPENCRG